MSIELTATLRHEVCIHEAAHAVIFALGRSFVYSVEVAPTGAREWTTQGRKGGVLADLWGVCRTSDAPVFPGVMRWDWEDLSYKADRALHRQMVRAFDGLPHGKQMKREVRRQLRAWICGAIAGPMADAIHAGEKPGEIWLEPNLTEGDDMALAEALSWLLPYRNEDEHLQAITERTLREPAIWDMVMRLASELEQAGCLGCDDGTEERLVQLLPAPRRNWPPSPRKLSAA